MNSLTSRSIPIRLVIAFVIALVSFFALSNTAQAAVNQAPLAGEVESESPQNMGNYLRLSGIDPDGDAVKFSLVSLPSHGTLGPLFSEPVTWIYTGVDYTPTAGYVGDDSFVYRVTDPSGAFDDATVTLHITGDPSQVPATTTTTVTPPKPSCNGKVATIVVKESGKTTYGTSGDDVIVGTSGKDVVYGQGGNDTICTLGGDDLVFGGLGNDWISSGDGNDKAYGGDGNDSLNANGGNDLISGENGVDQLTADAWSDTVWGGAGADSFTIAGSHFTA